MAATQRTSKGSFSKNASSMLKKAIGLILLAVLAVVLLKVVVGIALGFAKTIVFGVLIVALLLGALWAFKSKD